VTKIENPLKIINEWFQGVFLVFLFINLIAASVKAENVREISSS